MAEIIGQQGVLRVVPPAVLEAAIATADRKRAIASTPVDKTVETELASYIRTQYDQFRNHRNDSMAGWSERLLEAQRAFNGKYPADKLADIRKLGGSEVYARIVAMKCRGASSLLRDVYLAPDRPWGIAPPADPDIPPEVIQSVQQLVTVEAATMAQAGQPPDPSMIRDRVGQLMDAAKAAAKKQAKKRADAATDRIEEILNEGGFYKALAEFLVDLPLFPFACIKGPVVRIVPSVKWVAEPGELGPDGQQGPAQTSPQVDQTPRLFWQRTSPFDIWWTPGASDIDDAAVIERIRLSRADLNDLLDLPGYDHKAVREVLDEYGRGGIADDWDRTDAERAVNESRENPQFNRSGMINCIEFHGNVQGRTLREGGMSKRDVPDELRDYMVQAWLIGRHIIKVQLSPSPRKRHPYFITSFEKVPGTPVGNGLPDILSDVQDVCNASLRALVNNMSISSGPQVVVNDDRLSPGEDGEELYPWKRWHVTSDPMANNAQVPISFFQPNSNAQELLGVYEKFTLIADELSAIPRYMNGQGAGGAGRTASGLAMLMGNASKILQTVAANIDRDIITPLLDSLFDMIMLTDETGVLKGDESIRVMGVNVAVQRETQRARQLEFLSITANPMDAQIMGIKGRAAVLRSVSATIGLDGEVIVPSDSDLEAANAGGGPGGTGQPPPGGPPGAPGAPQDPGQPPPEQVNQPPGQLPAAGGQGSPVTGDTGPRTNIIGGGPQ